MSVSTALYRKYRPQNWDEVLGQEHIVNALRGAITTKSIAHAYLFFGTRGTGKTTVARILANSLGVHASDIYEIDAASNRGIDDIRELKESVQTLPMESPYKVYIIDEVHMLTKDAFNALLKTLEEPPTHVIFILATTELHKVIDTVISRCQVFTFRQPSRPILRDMVIDVAKREGFTLEASSAELIAILGDGSFRDTQGILQKVLSASSDKKITPDEVEAITGAPSTTLVYDFLNTIVLNDLNSALSIINAVVESNRDMKTFVALLLHKVRAILLLRFSKEAHTYLREDVGDEEYQQLKELSTVKGKDINAEFLNILLGIYEETKQSHIPQLPLELGIMKILNT